MNYLAHAFLSFDQPGILTGNMISDFVKGKKKFSYPIIIQKGISLHRAIDEFTDAHPFTQVAKTYFRKEYRLYSGAFIDVVYDHFLANDTEEFATAAALEQFCQSTYQLLARDLEYHPAGFFQIFPHMRSHDWLCNYRYREGIGRSFAGLARRAAYLSESAIAYEIFNENYEQLQQCYCSFFPALKSFATDHLAMLNKS